MNSLPEEYKKPLKILLYQIKSYGESVGSYRVHVDSDGYFDLAYEQLYVGTGKNQHRINLSEPIQTFFTEIIERLSDSYLNDNGMGVEFEINAETKEMFVNVIGYYYDKDYESTDYSFDEIRERFENFDQFLENHKDLGNTMVMTYEGGGDSGWINDSITGFDGTTVNMNGLVDGEFIDILYGILSSNFGAWGNNEGGNGEIYIYPKEQTMRIDHATNYEKSDFHGKVLTYNLN
jgi:hypothetical protein